MLEEDAPQLRDATPPPIEITAEALARLNAQPFEAALEVLLRCSHSAHWSQHVLGQRPFADATALARAAHEGWQSASRNDWLVAFAGHPLIGDVEHLRKRFDTRALGEQGQVLAAPNAVLEQLAHLNHEYKARHGFIFIVCASGLRAEQMLASLRARIDRPTDVEFVEAATQHAAINRLRLEGALKT